MDQQIEVPAARTTLISLNEYCLLEIFDLLDLDESINLAGTCSRLKNVANRTFKKYSKFRLCLEMQNKREDYIDNLFSYLGHHVSSLELDGFDAHVNVAEILRKISNHCRNLVCLTVMSYWGSAKSQKVPPVGVYSFDKVEMFKLVSCDCAYISSFLESLHNPKSLYIDSCNIAPNILRMLFQNNSCIKNFVYDNMDCKFNFQLLELTPKIEILSICYDSNLELNELNSILKLNRLTKLQLNAQYENVDNFLRELAKKGIVEEMHLYIDKLDVSIFDILISFDKLKLLVIESVGTKYNSSIVWPAKLKRLRLIDFVMTPNDIIAMIQQLQSLECIDLYDCFLARQGRSCFKDVTNLSNFEKQILHIIDDSNRKQQLNVVLPLDAKLKGYDRSKKCLIDSERLRILRESDEKSSVEIEIPGYDGY